MKTLIKNVIIVTMNEIDEIIQNGYIGIENDRIAHIGEALPEGYKEARVIDGKNQVVLPGLVNAHCHIAMTMLRGYADDLPLEDWLFQKVFPIEDKLQNEDIYWGAMVGLMEMVRTGTTCFADQYFMMDNVAKAVLESGMRANLTRCQMCFDENPDLQNDRMMKETENFYQTWNGEADGRISVTFSPHSVYGCTPKYIEGIVNMAHKYGANLQYHCAETRKEVADCIARYGKTPVAHLNALGVFDLHGFAAHCVHLNEEDMALMAQKKIYVVHNPGSNLKLASGIAPVRKYQEKGIGVALGTDGACSNNNLNMFEEINLAAMISKGHFEDAEGIKAVDALKMATVEGPKALATNEIGMLKVGMKADLVMCSLDAPHCQPMHNIVSALVYSMDGSDVTMTMVDGKILYQNGEYKTIDKEKVYYELKQCKDRLFN